MSTMSTMKNRVVTIYLGIAVILSILALTAVGVPAGPARAEAFSVETLEFVAQPSDLTATYGDKDMPSLYARLNYEVRAEYAWYVRATPTQTAVKVASGTSENGEIKFSPTQTKDSGYYYCVVSAVTYENRRYVTDKTTNQACVRISPKQAEVTLGETTFPYNGYWQTPTGTVKAEDVLSGDTVRVSVRTDIASTDVGTYAGTITLDNDNYAVKGNDRVTITITRAPLEIAVKEVAVRAGLTYDLDVVYKGFRGQDDATCLTFEPTVPSRFFGITEAGIYDVVCEGPATDGNYSITYPAVKLYVNEKELPAEKITGADATAGGSFKANTMLTLTEQDGKLPGFSLFKAVRSYYGLEFTAGGADGETFTLNLADDGAIKFLLAACYVDEEGKAHRVNDLTYKDGVVSVTLPTDMTGSVVVYNDYTLVVLFAGVFVFVMLIMIIVIAKSKQKYRRACYYYETARGIARERQEQQTYDE